MGQLASQKSHIVSRIREMHWKNLEEFIADLWEIDGWETELTPHNDKGVDVKARREFPVGIQAHIQVKSSKVGVPEINKYGGLPQHDEADLGVLVTSKSMTSGASELSKKHPLRVIDGERLAETIECVNAHDQVIESLGNVSNVNAINGIGEDRYRKLTKAGIHTVEDLIDTNPEKIAQQSAIPESMVSRLRNQAIYRQKDIEDTINGIGNARSEQLAKVGIQSVGDLATADPGKVSEETNLSKSHVETLCEQAKKQPTLDTTHIKRIGEGRSARLAEAGVHTVADLAVASAEDLAEQTGISESLLQDVIQNVILENISYD